MYHPKAPQKFLESRKSVVSRSHQSVAIPKGTNAFRPKLEPGNYEFGTRFHDRYVQPPIYPPMNQENIFLIPRLDQSSKGAQHMGHINHLLRKTNLSPLLQIIKVINLRATGNNQTRNIINLKTRHLETTEFKSMNIGAERVTTRQEKLEKQEMLGIPQRSGRRMEEREWILGARIRKRGKLWFWWLE